MNFESNIDLMADLVSMWVIKFIGLFRTADIGVHIVQTLCGFPNT